MRLLANKLALYGAELGFAIRAPATASQKLNLVWETLRFHARNGLGAAPEPARRMTLVLAIGGRRVPVTLRPDDGDLAILYEIFVRDAYRIDDRDLNPASVRVVIDAGANIGVASLYLAARYPNARIVSIEPNPDNLALLRANAAGEPRITIVQACLTGLPNQQVFIDTAGRGSHFQANTSGRGVAVPGISIQQLSAAERLGRIDLLKIDIEGGEKDVFAHPAFLSDVSAVVAELHPGYDLANFTRDLAPFGFKARASEFARDPNVVIAVR